jgi:uncharacterized membrane protein
MTDTLRNLNRFLLSQSFYPLCLSSLLAYTFFTFRVIYSGSSNYSNLIWNLFLAWLPYVFNIIATVLHRGYRGKWGLLLLAGIGWLVFFPNAPYIVTDFYHLELRPPIPLWFDISLIAIFAFTGCFLAIASLRGIHFLVEEYFGKITGWLFALFALGIGSLGVYLGRFGRWNSWDLLIYPKSLLKDIAQQLLNPLDNLGFIGFTLMLTSILIVFYLMFVSASYSKEAKM